MNSLLYLFGRIKDLYSGENYNKDIVDFINMFVNPLIKIDCIIKRDIADEFYNGESFSADSILSNDGIVYSPYEKEENVKTLN